VVSSAERGLAKWKVVGMDPGAGKRRLDLARVGGAGSVVPVCDPRG